MVRDTIGCSALAICLSGGPASAKQRQSEGAGKLIGHGPRLEALMKYLQDRLNAVGPVTYLSHGHDSNNGHDWTNKFSDEASRIIANLSACRINYIGKPLPMERS